MRLVLDLESSGLLRKDVALDDPSQPSIAQVGVALYDQKWIRVASYVSLIRPDNGFSMQPEAEAAHGISEAQCSAFGVPIAIALLVVKGLSENALQIVGHGIVGFDAPLIESQLARIGADPLWWKKRSHSLVDTMELSTEPCALPGKFGLKYPSLEEAHRHFLPDYPYTTAHEAMADVEACARVARALDERGLFPAPFRRQGPFQRMSK